jgi:hypothetical protein
MLKNIFITYYLSLERMAIIKEIKITSVGKDVSIGETMN